MGGMQSTRSLCLAATGLALVLAWSRTARADDVLAKPTRAESREHFSAGNRLYRMREFEKAIEHYKAGALAEDLPVFHYNLGQCYRMLGRYSDAIWHYERFLERAKPTGAIKEAVDGFLRQMKDELAKKAMTQPPVEPVPAVKPRSTESSVTGSFRATTIERGEPWHADRLGWVLAGTGAIGAGAGVALLVNADGLDESSNSEQGHLSRIELRERAKDRRLIGAVVGIAGGAVLVTGIVKLALHRNDRDHAITAALDLGASRAGVTVMGRF